MKTGYDRQIDAKDGMDCPVCGSRDTWRMKSLYLPWIYGEIDLTEELWECKACKTKWNYEQKIMIVKGDKR
jgi:hypothetical protein